MISDFLLSTDSDTHHEESNRSGEAGEVTSSTRNSEEDGEVISFSKAGCFSDASVVIAIGATGESIGSSMMSNLIFKEEKYDEISF